MRVQYVTASDGVSIAFADLADGYPIVYLGGMPFNHIQLVWRLAQYCAWLEQVYMRRRLVMFDARGSGLSDRGVKELSLESYGRDIDAVADPCSYRSSPSPLCRPRSRWPWTTRSATRIA